jgi:mRNA interferase RelE/StbE
MAGYSVSVKVSAVKELEKIPKKDVARLVERIRGLSADPRPQGAQKLAAQERFRIRQGDYRVVYSVDDDIRTIVVLKSATAARFVAV